MGKFLRFLAILVGVLVVLILAAVVVLTVIVDPNDYKAEIIAKVNEQTGRTLSIDGDLKLSVFPWLGIEIGKMALSNAEGFGDKPFAAVNRGAVHVKLMPLLSQELEVSGLTLDGLQLNLAKTESGGANWDDLAPAPSGAAEPRAKGPKTEAGIELALLSVGGIDINDASISWDDRQKGESYTLDRLNLKTSAITPGQPVDLSLGFLLASKAPAMDADVALAGRVNLDEAAGKLTVDGLKLNVEARGDLLPSGALEAELTAALSAMLNGQAVELKDLSLAVGDLVAKGELKVTDLNTDRKIDGKLAVAEFNLREWITSVVGPPPETADPAVLTRLSADMRIAGRGDAVSLEDLRVGLDDTRITGGASIKGEAISFRVDVDEINADRYLPPKSKAPAEKEAPKQGAGTGQSGQAGAEATGLMPLGALLGLNLNGVVNVGKLVIQNLQAEGVTLTVTARNGVLELDQKINRFYEGDYKGKVVVDARNETPKHRVDVAVAGVSAGPLLQDLVGEDRLLGKGHFSARLNTTGNSVPALKQGLGGDLEFEFADGAVKGINIAKILRDTRARFEGKPVSSDSEPLQTDFSKLSGTGVITKGVLSNKDLLAMTPFLRVTGSGQVDLVAEQLDYEVKPVVVATPKGQGGEGLEDLKGVTVPVRLTGPWDSPVYRVDWATVLISTQGTKIEEKKEEIRQQLEDKLQEKLKGLFQ